MALPDFNKWEPGTAIIWGPVAAAGGAGAVTANLSVNNLANNTGQMGQAVDLGTKWARRYTLIPIVESGTAPTANATIEIYLAGSYDNTNWPAGCNAADGTFPTVINTNKLMLGNPVSTLFARATANLAQVFQPVIWVPKARYVQPVLLNFWGQAIRNVAAAANNLSRLILVPIDLAIEDTA